MTHKFTANGSSPWYFVEDARRVTTCAVEGTFGGGTATLEWSLTDDATATTATDSADADIARTANAIDVFGGSGVWLRWTLSGATNPVLYVRIV